MSRLAVGSVTRVIADVWARIHGQSYHDPDLGLGSTRELTTPDELLVVSRREGSAQRFVVVMCTDGTLCDVWPDRLTPVSTEDD
jgi:hypothetical protein